MALHNRKDLFVSIITYLWQAEPGELEALESEAQWQLPESERVRAAQFRHLGRRQMYIAGRLLLRRLVAKRLGLAPPDVPLVLSEKGKPELAPGTAQRCYFNLAHSEDWLVVALSECYPLGVDIEQCRALDHMEDIAERVMHAEEFAEFCRLDGQARLDHFFHIWTAKEAFVKWCGAGLSYGLQSILIDASQQRFRQPLGQARLQFLSAPEGFLAALAYSHTGQAVEVREHRLYTLFGAID